ncbi:hypothetical protein GUJ93_ZPchr0013g35800 [Zizania palustris]|uniref:Uncharacterized protein n=1 Tax=Zizania palustris TaxID=103762 RepID=A0A8J6C2N6_ZIZPA|nr:hypothetical protein GUJ93_ZPchr0013g35800 [Zizania palustris]
MQQRSWVRGGATPDGRGRGPGGNRAGVGVEGGGESGVWGGDDRSEIMAPPTTIKSTSIFNFRSILERDKLFGTNFMDWSGPSNSDECHHCHKLRHWKRNFKGLSRSRKCDSSEMDVHVENGASVAALAIGRPNDVSLRQPPAQSQVLSEPAFSLSIVYRSQCTLRKPSPKATLREPSPEATLRKPSPEATLREPSPEATLRKPSPEATLRKPSPEATLRKPSPEATLRSPARRPPSGVQFGGHPPGAKPGGHPPESSSEAILQEPSPEATLRSPIRRSSSESQARRPPSGARSGGRPPEPSSYRGPPAPGVSFSWSKPGAA